MNYKPPHFRFEGCESGLVVTWIVKDMDGTLADVSVETVVIRDVPNIANVVTVFDIFSISLYFPILNSNF